MKGFQGKSWWEVTRGQRRRESSGCQYDRERGAGELSGGPTAIRDFPASNGHGRAAPGSFPGLARVLW